MRALGRGWIVNLPMRGRLSRLRLEEHARERMSASSRNGVALSIYSGVRQPRAASIWRGRGALPSTSADRFTRYVNCDRVLVSQHPLAREHSACEKEEGSRNGLSLAMTLYGYILRSVQAWL